MKMTGFYGERVGRYLHLEQEPSSLIAVTSQLRSSVTEAWNDNPVPGLSGAPNLEDGYIVGLKLVTTRMRTGSVASSSPGGRPSGRNIPRST